MSSASKLNFQARDSWGQQAGSRKATGSAITGINNRDYGSTGGSSAPSGERERRCNWLR